MTSPLQTICAARAGSALPRMSARLRPSSKRERFCMGKLLRGVFRWERLQTVHPKDRHAILLRLEHRDRSVRAHHRIHPRVQDLRKILRLLGRLFLAHYEKRADTKDRER